MNAEELIEKATESLGEIKYEEKYPAYFVKKNDEDMGNSDFCQDCIDDEVKRAEKEYHKERKKIERKFHLIETKGYCFHNGKKVKVKGKYTEKQIADAKEYELKEYPADAKFTYEWHDPDFGGGDSSPKYCEGCWECFRCDFKPDDQEMDWLEQAIMPYLERKARKKIPEKYKWELEHAFRYYEYCDAEIKERLEKMAVAVCIKVGVLNSNFALEKTIEEAVNTPLR